MPQKSNVDCAGSGIRLVLPAGGSMKHTSRCGASSRRRFACLPGNEWAYLYRAVDKFGNTIDFYLSATRNAKAAKRFLSKTLRRVKKCQKPAIINTDRAAPYGVALAELKKEGKCPKDTVHRQVKYLNNVVEADHGKLKQLIRPVRGFKTMKTAYATIKGFEVMRSLRKGQANHFNLSNDILGEARIVERAFGVGPGAIEEAITLLEKRASSSMA